jgi:hypothetical protein
MFTYFSETCCNSTIITDAHVVSRPHDHKSFDYEFCTLTSTLSNLNASCIYWIRLSDWMIFEYKTRDGKVNDCKWWSPCFVKVSTFVCQLEYNLYKWWWAGVSWVLGFSCLSSRWEILQPTDTQTWKPWQSKVIITYSHWPFHLVFCTRKSSNQKVVSNKYS